MDSLNQENLLSILKKRFHLHVYRHKDINWETIESKVINQPKLVDSLIKMEETGGEPDVFKIDGNLYFIDASKETPKGRNSCCYDKESRINRKKFPPQTSAEELAQEMGISLLDEHMYLELQKIDSFDLKTSSWIKTPKEIRVLGGALFGDKRYERIFFYHNGADSYYAARAFRGFIKIGE